MANRVKFTRPRASLPPARIRDFFLIIEIIVSTMQISKYFRDKDAEKERKDLRRAAIYGQGISRSLQIFLTRNSLISLCRGMVETVPRDPLA
jgi:hypothetical protein